MNKGFLSLVVVAIIGFVSLVAIGGGYGAYKYNLVVKEKKQVEQQLEETKDREIKGKILDSENQPNSPSTTPPDISDNSSLEEPIPKEEEISLPVEKVVEKDYKPDLITLYKEKIEFMRRGIALSNIGLQGNQFVIEEAQRTIDFNTDFLKKYEYYDFLGDLIKEESKLSKIVIEEREKIAELQEAKNNVDTQLKVKLEMEMEILSSGSPISKAEYTLRSKNLEELLPEDHFYMDKQISAVLTDLNEATDKIETALEAAAAEQKVLADREYDNAMETLKSAQAVVITPPVISPAQLKPTSINCSTIYDAYGNPITTCTDSNLMNSMTCYGNSDAYGRPTQSCIIK